MVGARRQQSLIFPLFLILVGAVTTAGLLVEGGREAWVPLPLFSIVLGAWLLLLPGQGQVDVGAPAGTSTEATLELVAGGAELQVRAFDIAPDLYRGALSFRGAKPLVRLDRGDVHIAMPHPWWRSLLPEPLTQRAVLVLNRHVRWMVVVRGDALAGRVDLSRGALRGFSLTGGRGEVQVDLPAPHPVVPVTLESSGMHVVLTVPDATPVQLSCERGSWHMDVPEHHGTHAPHLGQRVLTTGTWPAVDRYEVTLGGSAGHVRVERR